MGCVSLTPPRSPTAQDSGELGQGASPMDGSGYLLRAFNTQTYRTVMVPGGNKYREPDLLASTGLLLHRQKEHPQEKVSDLRCLDGQKQDTSLLQGLDLNVLNWANTD